ncbi:MAG TPA: hypothetical protein PLY45_01610 [bacterium]|nr:hypothetical protein [bacterium]
MAIPFIVAGLAAAAGWLISGCAMEDAESDSAIATDAELTIERLDGKPSPDIGYASDIEGANEGGQPVSDDAGDVQECVDEAAAPDAGGEEAPDADGEGESCPAPSCVSESAYACAGTEGRTTIVACDDKHRCEGGACVVKPELVDPECGGAYYSVCQVTDEYEVGVDDGRWVSLNDGQSYLASTFFNPEYGCDTYGCEERGARILPAIYEPGDEVGKDRWPPGWTTQIAMAVKLREPASYFKVDVKMDWTTMTPWPDECGPIEGALGVRATTIFGQWPPAPNSATKRIYRLDDGSWAPCDYATVAIYLSHKAYEGDMNLVFQNFGRSCMTEDPHRWHANYIAMARVRTVSCQCME